MVKTAYRLGEYRITEDEDRLLWWERHAGFGLQQSGKAFIFGEVLILGGRRREEHGFLVGEFLDQLKKLPAWGKTRYYCFSSELLDVRTGQSLSDDFLVRTSFLADRNKTDPKSIKDLKPGVYRLGQYHISVTDRGDMSWQTFRGMNRVLRGPCLIESGMLFLAPQEEEEGEQKKEDFIRRLEHLPLWDGTLAWGRGLLLRECQEPPRIKRRWGRWLYWRPKGYRPPDKKSADISGKQPEPPQRRSSSPSDFNFKKILNPDPLVPLEVKERKPLWSWLTKGKLGWKYLIILIIIGVLIGILAASYWAEKRSHGAYRLKEHHYKYKHH
jgi:hypothetical protein